MKAVVLAFAITAFASIIAQGQGQFVFNNHVPPEIEARFISNSDPASGQVSSIGTDYSVQLFSVSNGSRTPLDPPGTSFRGPAGSPLAGYVTPTTETVPGVPPGSTAAIIVRVLGPICDGVIADFGPWTLTLGGGTITPPNLPLGAAPLTVIALGVCPEPPTIVLTALAIGALAVWRWLRLRA